MKLSDNVFRIDAEPDGQVLHGSFPGFAPCCKCGTNLQGHDNYKAYIVVKSGTIYLDFPHCTKERCERFSHKLAIEAKV